MAAAVDTREHRFWVGLACAALLHAALIASAVRSLPRQMGEATGRPDGISVDLVDAADLRSKNTFAEDGGAPGAQKTPPPTPPAEPPRPVPAQPPAAKVIPAPPATAEPAPDTAREQAKALPEPVDKRAPELAPPPERRETSKLEEPKAAPKKQQEPPQQAQPKPQPQQKQALQLDLTPQFAPGDRGAAVQRPAGVTRSGENDEFGRGVIRALRKTIPSSNVTGRVTVRFLLSDTGNLVEVRLVGGSGDPVLSQNVVFAVKQSSFPIPPGGSTVIDRTFLVTYVYH